LLVVLRLAVLASAVAVVHPINLAGPFVVVVNDNDRFTSTVHVPRFADAVVHLGKVLSGVRQS
jgi:hypothetical protein